jgi:NodT family efflux transporter outer membrane factor (OMF) lipoprotein
LLTNDAGADSAWWHVFADSTLDQLIQLAYHQNLPLQAAGVRIMEARAQLGIAIGNQYPQVQAIFANATGVQLSKHAANSVLADRNYWDYQLGFDAQWEIDFWRKFHRGVRAASESYLATVADYDNALVSLTAETARTYAAVRTFEVLLAQANENAALQAEGLRIADARFRHGATSELDVAQARTLLEDTRSTIPQLETGLAQSKNALCTLVALPVGSLDAMLAGGKGIPAPAGQSGITVPAEMLRRRPDIRSAELNAAAQSEHIGIAKADLYPSFSLAGTIGLETSSGGGALSNHSTFSNLFSSGSVFYAFGPRLIWPIFNYGRITNNVRVQDARFQQLLLNYQETVIRAAQEVEDGLTGYLKSQESTVYSQNAVAGAQRAVDLAFIQYREGAVDFQRVLDAQRSLLQEQNALAQNRSSVATNLISLYKSLGGGWEIREGQPFVPDSVRIEMQHRTNWGSYFSNSPNVKTSTGTSENPR